MANLLGTNITGAATISDRIVIGGNFSNNAYSSVASTRLHFGGGDSDANSNYYIGTNLNNYGGNYTKLDLRWHTGIRMGARPEYGGIRFFNNETLGSRIMSIGETDANVRIDNNLYIGGAGGWITDLLNAKQNASTAITTSNWSSYAAPRAYVTESYVEFTIEGDANTYYPVTIHNWNGSFSWQRYSIHRSYSDTAPWDPIGTGVHRGGLTFSFEWAGDIAWGGNDKSIRVIEFNETYTQMVAGLQLAHCEGVVVWLRGGGAYYRLHGPGGRSQSYSINMSTWTSCAGVQYEPRSYDGGRVNSEINSRYPIRGNGNSDIFVNNQAVIHSGNIGSQSVSYASSAGSATSAGNADTLDSLDSSEFARGRAAYQVLNLDTAKQPGLYQYDGGIGGTQPAGTNWYNVKTIEIGSEYRYSQFVMPYSENRIFYRYKVDAGWQPYVELITSGNIGSQSVTYATNSTRLYASDSPYTYGNTYPYYLYMNYDGGSYWELKVSPATPGTVKVAYANSAGNADTVDSLHASVFVRNDIYNSTGAGLQVFRNIGTIDGSWQDSNHTLGLENNDAGTIVVNFHRAGYSSHNLWYNGSQFRFDNTVASLSDFRAPIFYDSDNTGYYLDPNGGSNLNDVTAGQYYVNGWFRNNTINQGLYQQAGGGNHFYAEDSNVWTIAANGSYPQIRFRSGGHQGTIRGYVYADTSNQIGFLNNGGGWTLRTNSSNNAFVHGVELTINADGASYSNIIMKDGDEGDRVIHCNSNRIGFLNQSGSWGSWCHDDGWFQSDYSLRAPIFYDSNDTTYYLDPNSTGTSLNIAGGINTVAPSGSVLLKHSVSEADAWIFQENAANWGLYWKNNSAGNHSFGSYTTVGAELVGMSAINSSGNAVQTSNFTGATSAYGTWLLSNYNGYIWSSSTIQAASDMRAPIFYDSNNTGYYGDFASTSVMNAIRFGTSTNNGTLSGNGDWGVRLTTDAGWIQFGPANSSWAHIYSNLPFYFNQDLYVNGTRVVLNSGTWGINVTGTAGGVSWANVSSKPATWLNEPNLIQGSEPDTIRASGFYESYLGSGNPTGTWMNYINVRHSNTANGHGFQLGMSYYDNNLWFRSYSGNIPPSFQSWSRALGTNTDPYPSNMNQYVRTTDDVTHNSTTSPTFVVNNHSDNTKGYRIHNTSGSSVSAMFTNSSNQLVIAAGAVDQINLNKKVYVNGVALGVNVSPSATAGRIDASNDIVAYSSSDERLKYNITPIENAIDKVKSLTGVEFDWKPEYKHAHGYEGHDTGIIAQQVQEVIPSAVRTNDTGFLAVRYEKLIGLLVEGMKEQQAQIEELKAKLDGLTK